LHDVLNAIALFRFPLNGWLSLMKIAVSASTKGRPMTRISILMLAVVYCLLAHGAISGQEATPKFEDHEGENLTLLKKSGTFPVHRQDMGGFKDDKWSNDAHMVAAPKKVGDWIELAVPVQNTGKYRVALVLTKAADYGIVQLYLDGKKMGDPVDCFVAGKVVRTDPISLGEAQIVKGQVTLKMQLVGTNPKSIGVRNLFALDYIRLTPLEAKEAQKPKEEPGKKTTDQSDPDKVAKPVTLADRLAGTKWINSNKATFEWDSAKRLLHNGIEKPYHVVDQNQIRVEFGKEDVGTLVFDTQLMRFDQFYRGPMGTPLFTGKRTEATQVAQKPKEEPAKKNEKAAITFANDDIVELPFAQLEEKYKDKKVIVTGKMFNQRYLDRQQKTFFTAIVGTHHKPGIGSIRCDVYFVDEPPGLKGKLSKSPTVWVQGTCTELRQGQIKQGKNEGYGLVLKDCTMLPTEEIDRLVAEREKKEAEKRAQKEAEQRAKAEEQRAKKEAAEKTERERREVAEKAERERREAALAEQKEFIRKEKARLDEEYGFNKLDYTKGPKGEELEQRQDKNLQFVQGFVKDGTFVLHGIISVRVSGSLLRTWHYNGKPHGVALLWDDNGKLASIVVMQNSLRQGLCREWHSNGKQSMEGNYKDDKREGTWKVWYENGQLREEQHFKNGKFHGDIDWWGQGGAKIGTFHYGSSEKFCNTTSKEDASQ
jgi:antitoxin component YwqK of YwqJK toxin-antitoxin module